MPNREFDFPSDRDMALLEQSLQPSSYLPLSALRSGDVLELFSCGRSMLGDAVPEFAFDVIRPATPFDIYSQSSINNPHVLIKSPTVLANYYTDRTAILSATPDLTLVIPDNSGGQDDRFSTLWSGDSVIKRVGPEGTVRPIEPTSLKRKIQDSRYSDFSEIRTIALASCETDLINGRLSEKPLVIDDPKKRRTYALVDKSTPEDTHLQVAVYSTVKESDYDDVVDSFGENKHISLNMRRIVYNASTTSPVLDGAIFFQPSVHDMAHLAHEPNVGQWSESIRPPQIYILKDGTFYIDQQGVTQSVKMQEHFENNIHVAIDGDNVEVMLGASIVSFPNTPDLAAIKKSLYKL